MKIALLFTVLTLLSISCGKDNQEQAIDSLIGKWNILESYYEEGNRVEFGTSPDTSFTQNNTGEFFNFESETSVSFEYKINGALQNGNNENWSLDIQSRKNGFTNSRAYFIKIEGESYEVQFGDRTSDSHENANNAKILYNSNLNNIGPYQNYLLTITKE